MILDVFIYVVAIQMIVIVMLDQELLNLYLFRAYHHDMRQFIWDTL